MKGLAGSAFTMMVNGALVLIAEIASCTICAAQPHAASDPKIRISVDLAQTDVVVVDRAGHPLRNLEPRDFQLFDNGVLQTITNFSSVDVVVPKSVAAVPSTTTPAMPPASVARREDLRRAIVLLVDDGGTNTADLAAILPVLRRFVADQIQPRDLAALTASRGGMGIYERLTSDRTQLNAAIDRMGHRPAWLICKASFGRGEQAWENGVPASTSKSIANIPESLWYRSRPVTNLRRGSGGRRSMRSLLTNATVTPWIRLG